LAHFLPILEGLSSQKTKSMFHSGLPCLKNHNKIAVSEFRIENSEKLLENPFTFFFKLYQIL